MTNPSEVSDKKEKLPKMYQLNLTEDEAVLIIIFTAFASHMWNSPAGCGIFTAYSESIHAKLHEVIDHMNEENTVEQYLTKMKNLTVSVPK